LVISVRACSSSSSPMSCTAAPQFSSPSRCSCSSTLLPSVQLRAVSEASGLHLETACRRLASVGPQWRL
jgi:hypothetical protein